MERNRDIYKKNLLEMLMPGKYNRKHLIVKERAAMNARIEELEMRLTSQHHQDLFLQMKHT
ncbi:hypothetical protein GNF82_18490, partial [Clostridium perfringens]